MEVPEDLSGEADIELAEAAAVAAGGETGASEGAAPLTTSPSPAPAPAEATPDPSVCRICGKVDAERQRVRFLPVSVDETTRAVAPNVQTWGEDITLHEFCGKTATILPNANAPEYEILPKAGIKNKHGIGTEVNSALARTRCSIIKREGAKEKQYYLVKEFEANLAAIRSLHQLPPPIYHHAYPHLHPGLPPDLGSYPVSPEPHQHHMYAPLAPEPPDQHYHIPGPSTENHHHQHAKVAPVRAAAGAIHKPSSSRRDESISYQVQSDGSTMTSDGKVRCGCGGTHLPPGTTKGAASWRNHVMTKRHQKWMEDNGLLGAV